MGERRGTKALELWCRRITEGYPGVNVQNMTTSWRDGLAFCAMIHHFRPDLVDFNSLNKDDVYGNNELAFRTAEQHLGIPALLDAEDMASCAVPDRLSILTYLSQFYQTFGGLSPSRSAIKRTKEESDERLASVSASPQPKVGIRLGVRKEPCVVCGLPVFLAEKLVISRSLYHRTCFRCARCNNQLTLGNYYETEEGQYCCETCPDEEAAVVSTPVMHQDYNQAALFGGDRETVDYQYPSPSASLTYKRALSDEEKTSKRNNKHNSDTASEVSKIRLHFMTNNLLSGNNERNENEIPRVADERLLRSPTISTEELPHSADNESTGTPYESEHNSVETLPTLHTIGSPRESPTPLSLARTSPAVPGLESQRLEDVNYRETNVNQATNRVERMEENVNDDDNFNFNFNVNQRLTAIVTHDVDNESIIKCTKDTKDTLAVGGGDEALQNQSADENLSIVQQRLKIFENSIHLEREGKKANEPNSVVRDVITSNKKKKSREKKKEEEEEAENLEVLQKNNQKLEEAMEESFVAPSSTQDSSDQVDVISKSSKPLELPEENLQTASISLKNTTDDQEPEAQEINLVNVSGIDLSTSEDYPEDLNPFQSDDDGEDVKGQNNPRSSAVVRNKFDKYVSTNPFGSSDEDEECKETNIPPRPAIRSNPSVGNKTETDGSQPTRRRLEAPQITLNPFWSDDEDHDSDEDNNTGNFGTRSTPIPKPRTLKSTPEPSPLPRKMSLDRGGHYASNSSIGSTGSLITPGGTYRKKKPAPPPPMAQEMFSTTSTFDTLTLQSPDDSQSTKVPQRTPRIRKSKPAPPPPISTSTPQSITDPFSPETKEVENQSATWDHPKSSKDETNRNRQSLSSVSNADESGHCYSVPFADKSAQGKWKRKKGPAPPRPIPHKRKIKVMSIKDVKLELDQIEMQQQGLEKQGVRLEQLIRDKCETGQENEDFTSLRVDVEELVLELFALVNEKNELFRRQAELMLLRRQQRLEEEHADVEYQIRCLMSQPEATKTDSDKQREEMLIQRLVEIVERRNEIVECLEMDRRREVEEDRSINEQMGLFAAKSKGDLTVSNENVHSSSISKKEKLKDKFQEKKVKKSHKKDADKDVDETEIKLKRHKRKWF